VDLDCFLTELKRGPLAGRVESLEIVWLTDAPRTNDFTIQG
jgi:hypothetical protein